MADHLKELESQRAKLYQELLEVGDLRRGSLAENYRRCGRQNCVCSQEDHPGHGPQYLLMTKVGGRSRARNLRAGAEVERVKEQLGNHQRFRQIIQQIVEVNEGICEERASEDQGEAGTRREVKKKWQRSSSKRSKRK